MKPTPPTPEEIEALHSEFGDRPVEHKAKPQRRGLAWLIAAPWIVIALIRVLALDDGFPLVPLISFVPLVTYTAILPVAVTIYLRVGPAAIGAAIALVALVLSIGGRAMTGPNPVARGSAITIMSLNTLLGKAETQATIEMVRTNNVDVLSVQELTPQLEELLREDGLEAELPYRLTDPRATPTGTGLWSRSPLRRTFDQVDPTIPEATEAVIEDLGLTVRSVHPSPPTSGVRVRRWRDYLRSLPAARTGDTTLRVLAGDFNATLDHKTLRAVVDDGYIDAADAVGKGLSSTWPATASFGLALDHVLVDSRIRVLDVQLRHVRGSDHRAVIARLRLP